jgi:(2Fe-2S) ferredoxin
LAAFQQADVPGWDVVASSCLGQCGNGPMVLVLPEEIWYCRVHPDEVAAVVEQHLRQGKAIAAMLYRKFHPLARWMKTALALRATSKFIPESCEF